MHTITIKLPDGRVSKIAIGESLDRLSHFTDGRKTVILTDDHVYQLYLDRFPADVPVIRMPDGEKNKTLPTVHYVISHLIDLGVDRNYFIVGIGGGIVCDLTGFIASIYMRGLRFGFVASTLLAQVDASVGGKNGTNLDGYKNMVGVFNQPDFVICDTSMLNTLAPREVRAGVAEVVKCALIADSELFEYIVQNKDRILAMDKMVIDHLVRRSVEIKAAVVEADERETGERRKLNLGHTFGHAIEKHGKLLHGEAVSVGMVIAANMSLKLGFLTSEQLARITDLLKALKLPVATDIPKESLLEAIGKDKKKQGAGLHFVLNKGIGAAEVRKLSYEEIAAIY